MRFAWTDKTKVSMTQAAAMKPIEPKPGSGIRILVAKPGLEHS